MMYDYKSRVIAEKRTRISWYRVLAMSAPFLALAASGLMKVTFNTEYPESYNENNSLVTHHTPAEPVLVSQAIVDSPTRLRQQGTEVSLAQGSGIQASPTPETLYSNRIQEGDSPIETHPPHDLALATQTVPAPLSMTNENRPAASETPNGGELIANQWLEHEIQSGDTLAKIFSSMGLSPQLLHRIVNHSSETKRLARIKPGQVFRVLLNAQQVFQELIFQSSPAQSLRILPDESGFKTQWIDRPLEQRTTSVSGIIQNSLFLSAQESGLPDAKIMDLANIFGWDIDFALEIRAGDQFSVVYQQDYLDGDKLRDGPILASEFINQGKTYRAVRYVDSKGRTDYFTPEGKSVRKAFLRTPVKFARISSRFNLRRKHPVLNRIRAHKGVDYAASKGTPVRASGDGRIVLRGRKGGYGKTVIIEHGGGISTLYAHLSKFSSKRRKGKRVMQGTVIGYVGQTGLATGPHLHYEFRVNGAHRNPLKVKLPPAKPIDRKSRSDFLVKTQPLIAQLDDLSRTMVANAE